MTEFAMSSAFARVLQTIVGVVLVVAGALYGVLGFWGVDRGGSGAWILALLGVLAAMAGAGLIIRAWRLTR